MRLFNADGSASEVSGNGIRCLAALAVRERPGTIAVTIDTPAGTKVLELRRRRRRRADVSRVDGDAAGHPADRTRGRRRESAGRGAVGWQPAMRASRRSASRIATPHAWPGDRTSSELSGSHERLVRESGGAQPRAHPDLGARRRPNPGLGHRRLRRGRSRGLLWRRRRAMSK